MSAGTYQIGEVLAGRAILWPDASETGTAPSHVVSIENKTVNSETAPTPSLLLDPSAATNVTIDVPATGYLVCADALSDIAYVGISSPLALARLTHHGSTQWRIPNLPSAATGTPLRSKSALAKCSELLNARRGLLRPERFAGLQRQLNALLSDEDELLANGIAVSAVSLDGLIEFIARHQPTQHPNVAVARDGRFSASWQRDKRAKVTLTFDRNRLGGDWVGVDLDAKSPARRNGAFVVDSLTGIAQPFRSWIKN